MNQSLARHVFHEIDGVSVLLLGYSLATCPPQHKAVIDKPVQVYNDRFGVYGCCHNSQCGFSPTRRDALTTLGRCQHSFLVTGNRPVLLILSPCGAVLDCLEAHSGMADAKAVSSRR